MRTLCVAISVGLLLCTGCAKRKEVRWETLEFRLSLRSGPYEKGDTTLSGEFEDLLTISLPVQVKRGVGEAHAVRDGVWLHVAWDDVQTESGADSFLAFKGFRVLVENRFSTPYGVSWCDNGWQDRGDVGVTAKWDRLQTTTPIDPCQNDRRVLCKMWRWARDAKRPDIMVGEKKEGIAVVARGL